MVDYTLYYWPLPFRGHFIRFALAYAGASWTEARAEDIIALKNSAIPDQPVPFMAPPLLLDHKTGDYICQLPAILLAIGQRYDLIKQPTTTMRLICDASDILFEITRYHGALMWDQASWNNFHNTRLRRWMQIHNELAVNAGVTQNDGFMCDPNMPSMADLTLAALWHTMVDRLPQLRASLAHSAPTLYGLVNRVVAVPQIEAVIADWSDCTSRYCGGQIETSLLDVLKRF